MECVRCVATLELKEVRILITHTHKLTMKEPPLTLLFVHAPVQLYWEDPSGTPIHLAGPPVFLRVCVLGQLQHTQLFRPTFPLNFHSNQLTFDRVNICTVYTSYNLYSTLLQILTNCSDPALLRETITGIYYLCGVIYLIYFPGHV